MKVNQVYEFLNTAISATGHNVTVTDTQGVVDFGKTLISDDNAQLRDNFFKKLIDRVGRTVIEDRKYIGSRLGIRKEPFEYGAILQKIYVAPMQARKNNSWDLTDGQRVPVDVVYKAQVEVTIFNAIDTWEVPITITREQIKSAFLNEQALGAFISALFNKVEDSLAVMYEQIETYAFATMIANALQATDSDGHNFLKVNLHDIVSVIYSINLTNDEFMHNSTNVDIIRTIVQTINKYGLLMEKMTSVFNSAEKQRFTPKDRQRLVMHNDLYTAISTVLKANTYHREDLSIPNASVVPYWQSFANERDIGEGELYIYPLEDKAIKISRDWGDGVSAIENDCVLAVLYDEEAIATTIDNRRTTTDVNGAGEFTNYYNKADIGYIIDPSENCIVFVWNY